MTYDVQTPMPEIRTQAEDLRNREVSDADIRLTQSESGEELWACAQNQDGTPQREACHLRIYR